MSENRKLVIVRHAHRNKLDGGAANNGLSGKGRKQAQALAKCFSHFFGQRSGKTEPVLYSSPKKRCIETLEPLAKKRRAEVQVLDVLNEMPTRAQLEKNVMAFDRFWKKSRDPLWVICSHGDWIPLYLEKFHRIQLDLDKAGWVEIEMIEGKATLRWIVQDPTIFS